MGKAEEKEVNINEINRVTQFGVAYREDEFLLIFNASNDDFSDGQAFIIPAKSLKAIVDGLRQCGIQYQQQFGQNIGFTGE